LSSHFFTDHKIDEKKTKNKKPLVYMAFIFLQYFFPVFCPKNWEFLEIFSFYNVNSINFEKKKNHQFFDITKLEGKKKREKNPWNLKGPNLIKPDNSFH
jgi:membrane protein CcdC involved in cytochrome C biogenesis